MKDAWISPWTGWRTTAVQELLLARSGPTGATPNRSLAPPGLGPWETMEQDPALYGAADAR